MNNIPQYNKKTNNHYNRFVVRKFDSIDSHLKTLHLADYLANIYLLGTEEPHRNIMKR